MKGKFYFPIIVAVIALGIVIWWAMGQRGRVNPVDMTTEHGQRVVVRDVELAWEENGAKVPLSEIQQGCFGGKDCISSIDNPVFDSVKDASSWLKNGDRVFVLEHGGVVKIYPQRIMNWHEIVNDWYEDDAIAVTFCPLCGSAVAFERKVDGIVTEFGVSGKLHNSDLVMYDRYEGSLWQQITGEAIVGPAARRDEVLEPLLLSVMTWEEASELNPEVLVLSRETGFSRDYGKYPYGAYESDDSINFPVGNQDSRLEPKDWVWGVEIEGASVAFPEELLVDGESHGIDVDGTRVTATYSEGKVTVSAGGEEVVPLRLFWFAWAAFHPDTLLHQ